MSTWTIIAHLYFPYQTLKLPFNDTRYLSAGRMCGLGYNRSLEFNHLTEGMKTIVTSFNLLVIKSNHVTALNYVCVSLSPVKYLMETVHNVYCYILYSLQLGGKMFGVHTLWNTFSND